MYSRHLQHAYRQSRSTVYQPPTEELRAVLERLVAVDTRNRRSHQLRLAELAWDTGDEPRFLELASQALLQPNGPDAASQLDFDYSAPARVLGIVIEGLIHRGRFADAQGWCDSARRSGYLDPGSPYYSRRLALMARRAEAHSETGPPRVTP